MTIRITLLLSIIFLVSISLASSLVINADYETLYPGDEKKIGIEIDNNENFDIEDVSVALVLNDLPFSSVGSSEKNIDNIDEDDEDSVSFSIKASTDIKPGDYNIPYTIKYINSDNDEKLSKQGSFGIRVSAKTEIDFALEVRGNAIVGREGQISLEIINKGLGEIKAVSVEISPQGYELLSKEKIFIGTVNADDTDLATFDVLYKSQNPVLNAEVEYKDFENKIHVESVQLPFKVYTEKEALELGLIKKSNTMVYFIVIIILIVAWLVYRKIRKSRKKKNGGMK